jgi:hypothetical protein
MIATSSSSLPLLFPQLSHFAGGRDDLIASGFLHPRNRTEQGIFNAVKLAVYTGPAFLIAQVSGQ